MEDEFGLELVYFQLDSSIPYCKGFEVLKRYMENNRGLEKTEISKNTNRQKNTALCEVKLYV